jgi:hypothetical protein
MNPSLALGEVRLEVMIVRRSFLAEMFKEALEWIARRYAVFELVARIGRLGSFTLRTRPRRARGRPRRRK